MSLKFVENAILLSAESKPYDFQGRQGTSHKVRLNIGGEIFVAKATEDQVSSLKSLVGTEGEAEIEFNSPKEKLSLSLVSFK